MVDSAGTVWPPAGEVGFSGVVEWCDRDIVVAHEVSEGAVGEGFASDGGISVGEGVCVCRGRRVSWRSPRKYVSGGVPLVWYGGMAAVRRVSRWSAGGCGTRLVLVWASGLACA